MNKDRQCLEGRPEKRNLPCNAEECHCEQAEPSDFSPGVKEQVPNTEASKCNVPMYRRDKTRGTVWTEGTALGELVVETMGNSRTPRGWLEWEHTFQAWQVGGGGFLHHNIREFQQFLRTMGGH